MTDSTRGGQGEVPRRPAIPRQMPPSIQPRDRTARPQGDRAPQPPASRPERPSTVQRPPAAQRPPVGRRPPAAPAPQGQRPPAAASSRPSQPRPSQAAPPERPRTLPAPAPAIARRRHPIRTVLIALVVALMVALVWFYVWVQSNITTVDALSGAADTPGDTYLIVGSDSREGWDDDGTEGARTDTIMVLHRPESGPVALISIPRDAYVEIPGHDANKINASFAWGGPQLLIATVEQHTGLTVDHYLEVGFGGVASMVDAVGGVELCYDQDVSDKLSRLEWQAGCHVADGDTALAFSRMRYADPLGDIGRTQRQRQVVSAVVDEALNPGTLLNPFTLTDVVGAGLDAFRVSEGTGPFDLARFALAFRAGMGGEAVTGTPPIASLDYRPGGVGSTVLLDPDTVDQFWADVAAGAFEPGAEVGGIE